jgi:hypothetical protein
MPTVWASVPMHAPTTTSLRRSRPRIAASTSRAVSIGYARSGTRTASQSTTCTALPYTTKNVCSGPTARAWTTIAGSSPIFPASWRAAPSARRPTGTGSVNDTWTIPSPPVSPYGRITAAPPPG